MRLKVLLLVVSFFGTHSNIAAAQESTANRGEVLFQRQCGACHKDSQTRNAVGPTLKGVIGRVAGTVEGFNYSPALKGSGITWTPETLDSFLLNPRALVRGTRMTSRVPDEEQRRSTIEFLAAP